MCVYSSQGNGSPACGIVVAIDEVDDPDAELAHYRAKGVRIFDQPARANVPLRRGWVLKRDAKGTVIELCPRGEVARPVRGPVGAVETG